MITEPAADAADRARATALIRGLDPFDERERADRQFAAEWVASGAPLHRTAKPDVPATHLVSYFAVLDENRSELLLVAHRGAGLWLPPGGHVEPGEDPWETVRRECVEELGIPAVPSRAVGDRPLLVTVTQTRGAGRHTDVSLWYVVSAEVRAITWYDEDEFAAIRWLTPEQVLAEPIDSLDPHMHRFTRKLVAALGSSRTRGARPAPGRRIL